MSLKPKTENIQEVKRHSAAEVTTSQQLVELIGCELAHIHVAAESF